MSQFSQISDGVVSFRRRGEPNEIRAILACQECTISDPVIGDEETPPIGSFAGRVHAVGDIADDVVELVISLKDHVQILPGQYVQVCFAGFPARYYSPTVPFKGAIDSDKFCLQVRRHANGLVSNALGVSIVAGHKVKIVGPFGSAYLRPGLTNRLVLVSSGAGFAPIWSIAHAALREMPDREIVVIVEAKDRRSLYMAGTLVRLAACPKVQVIPVIRQWDRPNSAFWIGNPLVFMPRLCSSDIVYASGAPLMVDGVASIARTAGARCYVDPFVPAEQETAASFALA